MDQGKKETTAVTSLRVLQGEVVSNAMHKTIVVKVQRTFKHATLGKVIRRSKKYKVHDENNVARVGDLVAMQECRPLSKTKHMVLTQVIKTRDDKGVS